MSSISKAVAGLAVALFIGGCGGSYYKVTDPMTHKEYYTTDLRQDHGSTILRDGKTGNQVTLQNSEIKPITKEEYETARVH